MKKAKLKQRIDELTDDLAQMVMDSFVDNRKIQDLKEKLKLANQTITSQAKYIEALTYKLGDEDEPQE